MGILNLRKNKIPAEKAPAKTRKLVIVPETKVPAVFNVLSGGDFSDIIIRPRVTEKATILSEKGGRTICVFEVSRKANKRNVSLAVKTFYKVTPAKVSILPIPPKSSLVRGRRVSGKAGFKAYVYLKKGERIDLI